MSTTALSAVIASVALVILTIGFLIGWARGYQRSILGLVITLGCAVGAFFLAPILTKAVLEIKVNMNVNGTMAATLKDAVIALIKSIEGVGEAVEASPTLADLIVVLPSLIGNVVLFIVGFLVLKLILWLILYLPIALTVFGKKRLEGKNKIKLLGAGLGSVSALVFLAVLMVPVFGAVSITNQIETAAASQTSSTQTHAITLVSDEPEENGENTEQGKKNNLNLEEISGTVSNYSQAFENTWIVKVYRAIGVGNLSVSAFDNLTTGEAAGQKVSLGEELRTFAKVVPIVNKLTKNGNKITIKTVDNIDALLTETMKSDTIATIANDIITYASAKWSNGEKAFGTKMPHFSDSEIVNQLVTNALKTLSGSQKEDLRKDVSSLVNALRVMVEKNVISTLTKDNVSADEVISLFSNSQEKVISSLIKTLANSANIKKVLPDIINVGLDYMYEALEVKVNEGGQTKYVSHDGASETYVDKNSDEYKFFWVLDVSVSDWEKAADSLQNMVGGLGNIYTKYQQDFVKYNEGRPESQQRELIDVINFAEFGQVIDELRASPLFASTAIAEGKNGPGKKLYAGILYSDMLNSITTVNVGSKTIAEKLLEDYSSSARDAVAVSFGQVDNMIKVAQSLVNTASTILENGLDKSTIADLISDVTDGDSVISDLITEDNLKELGVSEAVASDIQNIIDGITNETDAITKAAEIDGVATVLSLATQAKNGTIEIQNTEGTTDKTDEIIESITSSSVITDMLKDNSSVIGSLNIGNKIEDSTREALSASIEKYAESDGADSSVAAALRQLLLNNN